MAKMKDNTRGVLSEADRLIREKLVMAATLVERSAKGFVPVKTGTLKRSITHQPTVPKRSVRVGTNVIYGPFVEMGTSKMSARPYLRPALEANMPEIKRLFGAR